MEKRSVDISNLLRSSRQTNIGIERKCWLTIDGVDYLYKYNAASPDVLFGEVFISELCERIGIECVKSQFADGNLCVDPKTMRSIPSKGCLIKSYLESDVVESFSLHSVLNYSKMRNVEYTPDNVLRALEIFSQDRFSIDSNILQKLKIMTLFDYVTAQVDRHDQNVEFLVCQQNGEKIIKLAPLFDNGRVFNFMLGDLPDEDRLNEDLCITGEAPFWFMSEYFQKNDQSFYDYRFGIAKELCNNKELMDIYKEIKKINLKAFLEEISKETGERVGKLNALQAEATWNHKIEELDNAIEAYQAPKTKEIIDAIEKIGQRQAFIKQNNLDRTDFHINYMYDVEHGCCTKPLSEYKKQDSAYRKQVEAWLKLKTDELISKESFELLSQRCGEAEKTHYRTLISNQQLQRKQEMNKYQKEEFVPDYSMLNLLQALKDFSPIKSSNSRQHIFDKAKQFKEKRDKAVMKWIRYGDDLTKKPTFESLGIDTTKTYDEDVVEQYIRQFGQQHGSGCQKYNDWLTSVGKTEYAKNFNGTSLGD